MGVRETRGKEREETATPGFSAIFSMAGLDCVIDKESGAKSASFVKMRVQRWEKSAMDALHRMLRVCGYILFMRNVT